jgi:hypothetical protein
MALPARMTSAYKPPVAAILLLDAAKKDSTGTFKGPPHPALCAPDPTIVPSTSGAILTIFIA